MFLFYLSLTLGLVLAVGLIWFVSPRLSPIPYYPTLEADMEQIIKALDLKKGNCLYDLGAGDGKIIFRVAKPGIKTVGIEFNPYLVLLMKIKKLFHPQKKQITILWQDLFKTDLETATHIYLFVGPYLIDRIFEYIIKHKGKALQKIVSYRYCPKKYLKNRTKLKNNLNHPIFVWKFKTSSANP